MCIVIRLKRYLVSEWLLVCILQVVHGLIILLRWIGICLFCLDKLFVLGSKIRNCLAKFKHLFVGLQKANLLIYVQVLRAQQQFVLLFEQMSQVWQKVFYFAVVTVAFY